MRGFQRTSLLIASAVVAALQGGVPASSSALPRDLSYLPEPARARVVSLRSTAGSLRASLRAHTLSGVLHPLTGADAVRVTPVETPAQAITALSDATARVRALLGGSMPSQQVASFVRGKRAQRLATIRYGNRPSWPVPDPASEISPGDHGAAVALLAGVLDATLPVLSGGPTPLATSAEAECDVVDRRPILCVGSQEANTYTQPATLTIDLGGNDTYDFPAGVAPTVEISPGQLSPISLVVDVGGNDTYRAQAGWLPGDAKAVIGSGVGLSGGIGMLVDAGGDDVHEARLAGDADYAWGLVQGSGYGGTGVLLDRGGADRYTFDSTPTIDRAQEVIGQGFAMACLTDGARGCSFGALVDVGEGNDVYRLNAASAEKVRDGEHLVAAGATGQGWAQLGGTALLLDGGGTDLIEQSASVSAPNGPSERDLAVAWAQGQAFAMAGSASVVTGSGNTTYRMRASAQGPAIATALGQAFAIAGTATMSDGRGDDVYELDAAADDVFVRTVDNENCESPCERAWLDYAPANRLTPAVVRGQAANLVGGAAFLGDAGGDDRYLARASERLDVTLRDRLRDPLEPPHLTVEGARVPSLIVQGAADTGGVGVVVDGGGRDVYDALAERRTRAQVDSEVSVGEPEVTTRVLDRGYGAIAAQGSSVTAGVLGGLLDLGGTGDVFRATARERNETAPNPEGTYTLGWGWPPFQGAYGGMLVALGDDPSIVASPSRPVCATSAGRRGFGAWHDCRPATDNPDHQLADEGQPLVSVLTSGLAPRAVGRAPGLEVVEPTPSSAVEGSRIPVAARLTDGQGQPVAGAVVHFLIQAACTYESCAFQPISTEDRFWVSEWEVAAVTGEDGIARASLPIGFDNFRRTGWRPAAARVRASYDGSGDLYPRHVAKPITVSGV